MRSAPCAWWLVVGVCLALNWPCPARFSVNDRPIAPLLELLANDPDYRVRAAAAAGIRSHTRHPQVADALAAALKDPHVDVRWTATCGLGWLKDPRGAEALWAALEESDRDVRMAALDLIVRGKDAQPAAALAKARRDPDPVVRRGAADLTASLRAAAPQKQRKTPARAAPPRPATR